jgi:hypothetical protein
VNKNTDWGELMERNWREEADGQPMPEFDGIIRNPSRWTINGKKVDTVKIASIGWTENDLEIGATAGPANEHPSSPYTLLRLDFDGFSEFKLDNNGKEGEWTSAFGFKLTTILRGYNEPLQLAQLFEQAAEVLRYQIAYNEEVGR